MKMGWPEYYIPSPETVSRNVKKVFIHCRQRIAKMLQVHGNMSVRYQTQAQSMHIQEHEDAMSFATDTWTSPDHKAYIAVTVHFEQNGVPVAMLLDLVEVAMSHSGLNLAAAFAGILDSFGIADKVCN
jgi:hypothetical protein